METTSRNSAAAYIPTRLRWAGADYLHTGLRISLWIRWFVVIAWSAQLHQQNRFTDPFTEPAVVAHILFPVLLLAVNTYALYRIETRRTITWRWVFALSAMDVVMLTGSLTIAAGSGYNFFVLYYAAVAMFAAVCTSFTVAFAGATVVAAVHLALSLSAHPGDGFELLEETSLLAAEIFAMYGVVVAISLVSGFERVRSRLDRTRRRAAVERESELQQERIDLSQTIHDTIAQSAYLIGLGLETAIELADTRKDESRGELIAKLQATLGLFKSTMWELRHPIDVGSIFEGRELGRVLSSHASTFTTITSIRTELIQSGTEPRLPTGTRRLLFSIAHNAMTNAFRHSGAGQITIALLFEQDSIRMSVSDDGIGLPEDYADHGHGFSNMNMDAERMGGRLEAGPGESGRGTTITCVIPYAAGRGGA